MNFLNLFKNAENQEHFTAGQTIFRKGEQGSYMYVIVAGEVDILIDGKYIRTQGQGELLGEMALIDNSPRSADAVAKTDCTLTAIDERRFLFLVHETPMFALHVMSVMAARLRK